MTMKNILRLTALAVTLSFLALPARAQWGPEEEKNCFTKGMKGTITIAGQSNSAQGDSSKLEQYEEIPKGFLVPCAAYGWENQNYAFDVKGIDVGYDDMFLGAGFGKKGGFQLGASWDWNPNWQSNTARTPYAYSERGNTGYFAAPDDMQLTLQKIYTPWVAPTASNPSGVGTAPANPTVNGFYAVGDYLNSMNLQPFDLRYVRKTGRAGVEIPVGKALLFSANYSRETRKGNKNTTFYGGPDYEVATPIDYTTDEFRFGGEYAKGGFFANVSADFSNFSNQFQYNEIENPERLELQNPNFPSARTVYNDATLFRLWMPPDNKAYTVDATAGLALPAHHKITASLATGQMKMDHELRNLSTNDALGTQPVNPAFSIVPPYSSVEAKYDTFMLNFRFTGDPSPYFGYIGSYRKFELKDKSEEYEFESTVRGDVGASYLGPTAPLVREHFGWSIESLRGEVHVLPVHALRLGLSYNEDKRKFDVGEFEDVKDKTFVTSVDWGWQWVALHGAYTHLKREPGTARDPAIWQGATFTDNASRTRTTWSGLLTLTPVEKLAVSFTGLTQKNDFPESTTGLLAQKFDTFGVDVTYAANEKVNFMAGYVYEKYFFDMAAAYIPRGLNPPYDPANLWGNQTTDKVDTFRAGLSWAIVPEKLDFDATLDYTKPRSDSLYDFAQAGTPIGGLNEANGVFPANVPPLPGFPVTTFDSFPTVVKKFTMAKLRLAYHLNKSFTASVLYWKQKYDNTDWQTENPGANGEPYTPYMGRIDPGSNRWFFLGARVPSYDADIFRVGLTYTF